MKKQEVADETRLKIEKITLFIRIKSNILFLIYSGMKSEGFWRKIEQIFFRKGCFLSGTN